MSTCEFVWLLSRYMQPHLAEVLLDKALLVQSLLQPSLNYSIALTIIQQYHVKWTVKYHFCPSRMKYRSIFGKLKLDRVPSIYIKERSIKIVIIYAWTVITYWKQLLGSKPSLKVVDRFRLIGSGGKGPS